MSTLLLSDVEHVVKLANLQLTKEEIKKFQQQLSSVIEYFNELQEVDTSNIESLIKDTELKNVTREDEVHPESSFSQDNALSGSDKTYNGYFKIPLLVEKNK